MPTKPRRITRRQFYARGGLSNPKQFRDMRGTRWTYWSYE